MVRSDVKILGKTYTVRSEYDQAFMDETAEFLNGRMRELTDKAGAVPAEKVAILTAMNLAGELLRLQKDTRTLRDSLRKRTKKLIDLVDAQV